MNWWYTLEAKILAFADRFLPNPYRNWVLHAMAGAVVGTIGMLVGGVLTACLSAGVVGLIKEYMDYRSGLGQVSLMAAACTLVGGCLMAAVLR